MSVPARTKRTAKANEDADITAIIALLNDATSPQGSALRDGYAARFGTPLTSARRSDPATATGKRVGSRGVHYDFQVCDGTGRWLNVEHKGSKTYAPIDPALPPWTGGVQFYNGGMEKYRLARRYAVAWYDKFVGSGLLKTRYGLTAPIPSLEEWIAKDAKTQGPPKTAFGKELKATYQATAPGKSLTAERDEFVAEFSASCDEADCVSLKEDILPLVRDSLAQKDVWLQIAGAVNGEFHFAWSPQLRVSRVDNVVIRRGRDIELSVTCDGGFQFGGILRWGYGAGFSNLRLDLR